MPPVAACYRLLPLGQRSAAAIAAPMARPAATTSAPNRSPGARVRRSTGPLMLTAAITRPARSTHRGAHRGDAGLTLLDALDPAAGRDLLAAEHTARRTDVEREEAALGHDPAQRVGRLQRHHAATGVALAHVQLHALAARVAQLLHGRRATSPMRNCSAATRPRATSSNPRQNRPCAVAADEVVLLERDDEPVGGRPRQAGRLLQLGQVERPLRAARATAPPPCRSRRRRLHCPHSGTLSHILRFQRPIRVPMKERSDMPPTTLPQKVWDRHVVHEHPSEPDLLYIDLHLVHEVTSPQAFDGLRLSGRTVRRPDLTIATEDHNVPTADIDQPIADPISARQVEVLRENTAEFGIINFPMGDPGQGIVHVIGPEQGRTLPGMTIVCGDSHTATHGAFGALAFGIGTSEVEHVLATQTLPQSRPKWMAVTVEGDLADGVTAKDVILAHHRRDRHRRRHRPRDRVPRRGHPGAVDGRPHDRVQHDHRGRRQGRPDRSRRHHVRVPEGPRQRTDGRRLGRRRRRLAHARHRRRRRVGQGGRDRRGRRSARRSPGAPTPARSRRSTTRSRRPTSFDDPTTRETVARALEYMGLEAGTPHPRHHGRHRLHRQLHQQPHRGPACRGRGDEGPHRHRASA